MAVSENVSIHAPAWGATTGTDRLGRVCRVSIHAPAWGATSGSPIARVDVLRFNPRARVGRDSGWRHARLSAVVFQSTRPRGARQFPGKFQTSDPVVSIHAPAWGATSESLITPRDWVGFNPRARVGRDSGWRHARLSAVVFQSTRPRGARQTSMLFCITLGAVSIHAPAWGATLIEIKHRLRELVSIHAPAWGATPSPTSALRLPARFNPRARVGRDWLRIWQRTFPAGRFNPRARVGRDPQEKDLKELEARRFNPRARVGRDSLMQSNGSRIGSFNPRARVGRDAYSPASSLGALRFNPRARVGRDLNR